MSSSSALVVGVASALARLWHLEDRPEWRCNIPDVAALATYFACLENGSAFGDFDGDAGVGTHGGSEDHAAMVFGTPGVVTAFSFVPMRRLDDARVPDDWRFVVAPSGVTAEKTGTAREAYNRLSEGADVLLRLWNARHEPARSLAAALGAQPGALDELRQSIRASHVEGWGRDELERRLEHFRREDARVPDALRAFQRSEAAWLGELSEASQQEAGELLGNQIPETRALAEKARALGAFAACSFGAGFGGSVWALVERERAVELCDRWGAPGDRSIVPRPFVLRPGPPIVELIGG
jgi:galactokinase